MKERMYCINTTSRISLRFVVSLVVFIGVMSLLGVVLVSPDHFDIAEMSYQKMWLSRMTVVFAVCSLFSLSINDRKEDRFYNSVIWSLILLGGVEAIWGLGQIYGQFVSHHSLFALTGSFYNPGPYSGYLAMVFPICLGEWLLLKDKANRKWIEQGKYYISLGVLLLIICVLPAGMSRSAWLATVVSGLWVYGVHYSWGARLRKVVKKYKKRVFLVAVIGGVVVSASGYALFFLKADSASGRLLMWKVTSIAIAEKPLMGYGLNGFSYAYGMAQEKYFANANYSETEELVAGSPEYAFNEYLQVAVEQGIPFLLVVLFVISFSLWKGATEKRFSTCGGVISILIFAFFSYPMQIPGFAVAFYFLLAACVVGRSRFYVLLFTVMITLWGTFYWNHNWYDASKKWSSYQMLYKIGAYQAAKEGYETLYSELNRNGTFLFEYGHCLHKLKDYESSTKVLKEAIVHCNDPMVLNIIGKNYQAAGEYGKAEGWLIRSTHRLPNRIYPYYLLAKLYAEPGYRQLEKLKSIAEIVLTKEPKVQSTAVKEMREEVKKLVVSLNSNGGDSN
ncbi:O-antigen ligase family protein [Bacteroides sp.]|uniref:O-antigen ligase family protein n=1 Tax=Bacteroides sp. TaxID=29523 RepID=UPI00262104C1|nr:O-antigen ligase family protein [Bacteroides sp.]MDD3037198.1 O-antigen ligase family protein [Bacteroides sp.]